MSLNTREQNATRAELNANLELAQLRPDDIAAAVGLPLAHINEALAVSGARPEHVWLVRDYLELTLQSLGRRPHPYSKLTEPMRAAARAWFPLVDVEAAINAANH